MKKKLFFLSAWLVLASVSVLPLVGQETTHYRNEKIGLSMDYPSGWYVDDQDPENIVFMSSASLASHSTTEGSVVSLAWAPLTGMAYDTLDAAYKDLTSEYAVQGAEFSKIEEATIGGVRALSRQMQIPEIDVAGRVLGLVSGDSLYVIIAAVKPAVNAEQAMKIVDAMVASIELFEAVATGPQDRRVYPDHGPALQEVIDAAGDHDTLILSEGTYAVTGRILISNKYELTIRGEGETWIVSSDGTAPVIEISDSASIWMDNLHFRHAPDVAGSCTSAQLVVSSGDDLILDACEIVGCGPTGVSIRTSSYPEITGCTFHGSSSQAIELVGVYYAWVHGNTFAGNAEPVRSDESNRNIHVENNTIEETTE